MSEILPNPNYTTAQIVERFIEVRDMIAAEAEEFKAKKAALEESLESLNQELFIRLKASGGSSLKFAGIGTVISKTTTTPKTSDVGELLRYIQETGKVELLQARISTSAIAEWAGDNGGAMPPGVVTETTHSIVVRRA